MDKKLQKLYFNPSSPASYTGLSTFKKNIPVDLRKSADKWLTKLDVYNLHKPVIRKFQRANIIVSGIGQQYQIDLIDTGAYAAWNDNYKYILTAIDVFSKFAYVEPIKRKTGVLVTEAFEKILRRIKSTPLFIQSDQGKEFLNKNFQGLLRQRKIEFFTSLNDDIKCAIIERFQRTLMNKIFRYFTAKSSKRYIDILQKLVNSYNHTIHRSIGLAPADVNSSNQEQIWLKLYKSRRYKKPNFKVGDFVRISKTRHPFAKGYIGRWSKEIFTVTGINPTIPATYDLRDLAGENISGVFYSKELITAEKSDFYEIEKILDRRYKNRKNEYFVKWVNHPAKFNSWVNEADMKAI